MRRNGNRDGEGENEKKNKISRNAISRSKIGSGGNKEQSDALET